MPADDLQWAAQSLQEREATYSRYHGYYDGDQRMLFATEKFRNTFGSLLHTFADNLCPTVVDAVADRLEVEGFDGAQAKQAQKLWDRPRLKRLVDAALTYALKLGDGYLIVWPDDNNVVQLWPQDPRLCTVEYDTEQPYLLTKGAKGWIDDEKYARINLYYPDHTERYRTNQPVASGSLPTDGHRWEVFSSGIPAETPDGDIPNPWGVVPIFHFANNTVCGEFGRSELHDVIPLQDVLNKSVMDMIVAMEFVAYPQRWAVGLEVETDPSTGKAVNPPFTPGVDRIWTAAGDVKFGQFSQADLDHFIRVQDGIRKEIGRVTGTPMHYLGVEQQVPSGEALKVSEGRLVRKVIDRQDDFGAVLSDALAFSLYVDGVKGSAYGPGETLDDWPEVKVLWQTAAPHNPLLDGEVQVVKQSLGVSTRQSLRELGYTDTEIDDMLAEQLKDDATKFQAQQQAAAQQTLMQGFTGGGGQTTNGSPGASGTSGQPQTTEGGKLPLPAAQKPGNVLAPKPRVTVGKDWFES